jgi:hypothetical protein
MVAISLAPGALDLAGIRAGDRNLFLVTIRQGGVAVDLTSYTITAQARLTAEATTQLNAVCTIVDAPAGKVQVRWPGEDVRTWLGDEEKLSGVWDLQLDDGVLDPWTVVAGSFAAEMDVTRP